MNNSSKVLGGCLLIVFAVVVALAVTVALPAYIIAEVVNSQFHFYINTWNVSFLLIALYIIFYVISLFFKGGNRV